MLLRKIPRWCFHPRLNVCVNLAFILIRNERAFSNLVTGETVLTRYNWLTLMLAFANRWMRVDGQLGASAVSSVLNLNLILTTSNTTLGWLKYMQCNWTDSVLIWFIVLWAMYCTHLNHKMMFSYSGWCLH